ncbi:hypothetical protein J437_LFUL009954 [Ladona fulva]|uniref:Tetraspanin n=1 Tax=Ladona fulva TaxID=123851 RepID=A0A8K0NZT5_LADFU|nr:hypothetical protein J437_LFUL009954 [Ladona fulva]
MESLQYSPGFPEEKTKSSLSFSDGFFSRKNKPKGRRENVSESDFENLFNFSFIFASSLFLAAGILVGGVGLWTMVRRWKIPTTIYPKPSVFITTSCFALVVGMFSPIIARLSCLSYHEGRNQKLQILLPSALGFVAIILMLIGAVHCFQFRSSLSMEAAELHEVGGNPKVSPWRQDLKQRLYSLLSRALPGNDEMEDWNTMQSTILCCGVEGYRDWLLTGKKDFVLNSCCISYDIALEFARNYSKTDDILCCEHRMLDCINGVCGKLVPFLVLNSQKGICSLEAITPMGCAETIELILHKQASISGSIFLVCIAIYVIAEIIMGVFLFI